MKLKTLALLALATLLCGCASWGGNAAYHYRSETHPDGTKVVTVDADSGRNLAGGFKGGVTKDGALTLEVGSATQGESRIDPLSALGLRLIEQRVGLQPVPAQSAPAVTVEPPK